MTHLPAAAQTEAQPASVTRPHCNGCSSNEFVAIASHELKEPLRGISAYCNLLLEDYRNRLDYDGQRRLEATTAMCDRLSDMVEMLSRYCHVAHRQPSKTETDLARIVDDVLRSLHITIDQRRGSVRIVGRLPVVCADATLVGMVLGNLISNGLKFNRNPRPQIEIGALPGDSPIIYVRDNGIGVAPREHAAIFTAFRRLHSRTQYAGTGMGLAIVRDIVESHGGRIWLESTPGRGATFFFTLAPATHTTPDGPPPHVPHWHICDVVPAATTHSQPTRF